MTLSLVLVAVGGALIIVSFAFGLSWFLNRLNTRLLVRRELPGLLAEAKRALEDS